MPRLLPEGALFKPLGYPEGVYRVGPLARLNVADRCGTPRPTPSSPNSISASARRPTAPSSIHYARLIEIIYALERMEALLDDPAILDTHVRAHAGVNALEGVGMIEAPRGVLIHHYKVDENGAIVWANLIVATGHNNLAMAAVCARSASISSMATTLQEGMLNRVSAVVRAYDPCLSCSTHAVGLPDYHIRLLAPTASFSTRSSVPKLQPYASLAPKF